MIQYAKFFIISAGFTADKEDTIRLPRVVSRLTMPEECFWVTRIPELDSLDLVALVLRGQGKYEAAEEMSRRALEKSFFFLLAR
jgi:predicted sugar kinase